MDTYIGLDAHASSRYWGSHVVETNAKALIEVLRSIPESDKVDAFGVAERLRIGEIKTKVYKERGRFGALGHRAKAHWLLVADAVRVMSRIKSLMRSRGVQVSGTAVYCATGHSEWITRLPQAARPAMELLYRGKTDQESRSLRVASQLDWSLLAIERRG